MTIRLVTDEKIAETSSKGNQEKWYDQAADCWYKLDQFGYEALAETVVSVLLEQSNLETDTPFTFVSYGATASPWPGAHRMLQQEFFTTWPGAYYSQSSAVQSFGKTFERETGSPFQ